MAGIRRVAVLAAAFLLLSAAWATAQSPSANVLPAGTAVVFVTDGSLEPGRREGSVVTVHLRDALIFDGTTLAAAGTRAELFVGGVTVADGKRRPVVVLQQFKTSIGLMPVKPVAPIVPPIASGAQIEARTEAVVDHIGARFSIRVPFPFGISADRPASAYTPTPARTATVKSLMRPGAKVTTLPTPTVAPTVPATPVPIELPTPTPAPVALPTPTPAPTPS
ncbi:MAG TPA: hypothetical protein VHT05_12265 [Candidatus Elarobacter sp.]|nr:hypothetical protein [Candidatus Elarobacter sp.]